MSPLVEHATNEIRRAGLLDADADHGGALGASVIRLVEEFAKERHSGFSAHLALTVFDKVARFQTLTPITADPSEWNDVSEMSGKPMWQNNRDSRFFSEDGGATWKQLAS